MDQTNSWYRFKLQTTQKFLQIYLNNRRHNSKCEGFWMPDQRQKQKPQKRESVEFTEHLFQWMKESGLIFEPAEPSLSLRTRSRRKSSNFFDIIKQHKREDDGAVQFWRIKFHLQNQSPQNLLLVGWSLESMLGSRRRIKKKISVLFWYYRNNCLPPSSSRTFRT